MKNLLFQRKTEPYPGNLGTTSSAEAERLTRWATLLRERPSDTQGDEMSKWLLSVLQVSNPGGESYSKNYDFDDDRESNLQESSDGTAESSSSERSAGSGASGGASWNSSSESFGSGGSSEQSESSSVGDNEGESEDQVPHHQQVPLRPPQHNTPVVSDFRSSTGSPSGSTDAGGVDTTTSGTNCYTSSGSGSHNSKPHRV